MSEKPSQRYSKYAQSACQTTSQVQPALVEKEEVSVFMSTLFSTNYDRLISHDSSLIWN